MAGPLLKRRALAGNMGWMTEPMSLAEADALALRRILQGTATETGEGFFRALVENLAGALGTYGAWVTEYLPDSRRLRALAFWLGGRWVEHFEQGIDGTPCEAVVDGRRLVHLPERILELYPHEVGLQRVGAVSYMGVPLEDLDGSVLGHLAVLDRKPMPHREQQLALFEIFAARAAAELRRLRAERERREGEAELRGLVESACDAILQLDSDLCVVLLNPSAERTFELSGEARGTPLRRLLGVEGAERVTALARELVSRPAAGRCAPFRGELWGQTASGTTFPAEATLSSFELKGRHHFTLILRNVKERVQAERTIVALATEAECLRAELRDLGSGGEIIGQSESLASVLAELQQVAPAPTTVLLVGETGTGKELFARALHAASDRRDRPLVKVNCAAIPAALIESEFFGHERGAFTGATSKRDGRFALADGGTIFLDEVGELPLELQGKLLRVLQEGEFEPVGSSRTRKVDVRVVAATHRDLFRASAEGRFREDLYYRLSVFPITLPPLRERGADIDLLAREFACRFAARMGRQLRPLSAEQLARLRAYHWPGNVRELANVIERAVITARDGVLQLDRALPAARREALPEVVRARPALPPSVEGFGALLTAADLVRLERENLERALELSGGQVAGENGAARRLGMAPSTLSSRLTALGMRRPS